jgi:hypothetical protein
LTIITTIIPVSARWRALGSGCHHTCVASPDEGSVVVVVTDSHLAHSKSKSCLG